jgi:hypothetical protein
MKISERTVKRLGEIITGAKGISPYRGGPKLVSFFNECGTNHTDGQGFPSRWMFAEECIRQFNDTPTMKKVILSAVDPRDFMGTTVYDKETKQEKPANLQDAVTYLNEFLAFDGYEIVPHGKSYDVVQNARRDCRRCEARAQSSFARVHHGANREVPDEDESGGPRRSHHECPVPG